jgi:hypothetical protein
VTGKIDQSQQDVCRRFGAEFMPTDETYKLGMSENAMRCEQPLNGLRHSPESGTSGWFIWGGEQLSSDPEFFKPVHVYHAQELCPEVLPYLALPPGWRFLIADGYEDVWFDEALLSPSSVHPK